MLKILAIGLIALFAIGCRDDTDTSAWRYQTTIRHTNYFTSEPPIFENGLICFKDGLRKADRDETNFTAFCTTDRDGRDAIWILDRGD